MCKIRKILLVANDQGYSRLLGEAIQESVPNAAVHVVANVGQAEKRLRMYKFHTAILDLDEGAGDITALALTISREETDTKILCIASHEISADTTNTLQGITTVVLDKHSRIDELTKFAKTYIQDK